MDHTAVHPESYHIVEQMAKDLKCTIDELIADKELRRKINISDYITPTVGLPTLQDILDKLPKRIETEDYEFELYIYYHENGVSVFYDDGDITQLAFFSKPTLLESAYEMLCWCIENGYVKVGKEE